jgi:very-short-patch-repair endonuclease
MTHKTQFARHLRQESTDAERLLWSRLRARRFFNLKFKRQQPLGAYIVDFVCFEAHLIIELDGGQHAQQLAYDRERDAWLAAQGFTVLRFWNNEAMNNLEGVLTKIAASLPPAPVTEEPANRKTKTWHQPQ